MLEQFSRTQLLVGAGALEALGKARVAVFGLGGVGGYTAEALARSGVGAFDLVDDDVVGTTNLNRQIIALHSTIGCDKVDVMAERIADINPQCRVMRHKCFYLPDTAGQFDFSQYDYVVDAVDTVTAKLQLITAAHEAGVPIISSMGAANKLDACAFKVADIYKTSICPLAKIIRKECRKRGIKHLKVVYSTEPPLKPSGHAQVPTTEEPGPHDVRRSGTPGSMPFVPPVAGLIMAGEVVKDLTRDYR